jgi:hypothetical protein
VFNSRVRAHAHTRPHARVRTDPKDRHTHPEGLPEVLAPIVADSTAPTNYEDLVEILGEIADPAEDAEAEQAVRAVAAGADHPKPVRWEAT